MWAGMYYHEKQTEMRGFVEQFEKVRMLTLVRFNVLKFGESKELEDH